MKQSIISTNIHIYKSTAINSPEDFIWNQMISEIILSAYKPEAIDTLHTKPIIVGCLFRSLD